MKSSLNDHSTFTVIRTFSDTGSPRSVQFRCVRYWMGIQLRYSNKSLGLMFSNFQILTITGHFRKHHFLENFCLIPFFFLILKQRKVLSVCWLFPIIRLSHFQKVIISGKLLAILGHAKTLSYYSWASSKILYSNSIPNYLIIPFIMSPY